MKAYRLKLENQRKWALIFLCLQVFVYVLLMLFLPESKYGFSKENLLFLFGPSMNSSAIYLFRSSYLLKNEKNLNTSFIQETDERNIAIEAKAARTGMFILLISLYLGLVLAFVLHKVVFYTLLGILIYSFAVFILMRLYYKGTM